MFTVLIVLALIGSVVAFFILRSGETLRFETTSSTRQITMAAVGLVATKRRWLTISQGDGSANFSYHRGANKVVLVLLLLCFVLPGFVYWILSGRKESLAVNTEEQGGSMSIVQVSSNGWRGKVAGRALRTRLGLAPGTNASIISPPASPMTGGSAAGAQPAMTRQSGNMPLR
jgi:hypothetical protein